MMLVVVVMVRGSGNGGGDDGGGDGGGSGGGSGGGDSGSGDAHNIMPVAMSYRGEWGKSSRKNFEKSY